MKKIPEELDRITDSERWRELWSMGVKYIIPLDFVVASKGVRNQTDSS